MSPLATPTVRSPYRLANEPINTDIRSCAGPQSGDRSQDPVSAPFVSGESQDNNYVVLVMMLRPIDTNSCLDEERDRIHNRRRDQWCCLPRQ